MVVNSGDDMSLYRGKKIYKLELIKSIWDWSNIHGSPISGTV